MAGIVILTIISFAAVLFLIYFFIALWKDGKPRVKCRVQRIGPDPDIILPVPKRAMKPFTLLQMKCEFESGSMNDKKPREWHFERWEDTYPTQRERKPGRAM
jgi:hypothetical protein